jgi:putative phosphoribosyl transferase
MSRFRDRIDAGRQLAQLLARYRHRSDVVVLGLPRGGVPVAAEVARALQAPLDVFLVRKLGVPGQEELAMGAIASGGVRVLNHGIVAALGIPREVIEAVTRTQQEELARRERELRGSRPPPPLRGRTIILVDDGLATGSTMRAAVIAVRHEDPREVVVAVPVAALPTYLAMHDFADDVVAVEVPDDLYAVGAWYQDFSQIDDEEARAIVESAPRAEDHAEHEPHPTP